MDLVNLCCYGHAVFAVNYFLFHVFQAGTVWANCWLVRDLNMPFGGMKESGTGRESAKDSLEFFTEEKTICVKL